MVLERELAEIPVPPLPSVSSNAIMGKHPDFLLEY
jgi:hypothetical protein